MTDYTYPEFDKEGKVICQLCGKALNIISPSHLRKHEMSLEQYKERFKDLKITGEKYRTVQKFCHATLFAPQAKPLTQIMEEVLVNEPKEPTEDDIKNMALTKEVLNAIEQQKTTESEIEKPKIRNPMQDMKARILELLKRYFIHVQQNYTVQEFAPSGHLLLECITDFADPVTKTVINFPKTFWHNKNPDPAVNTRMSEYGWKVIEIHSLAPSNKEISEVVEPYRK